MRAELPIWALDNSRHFGQSALMRMVAVARVLAATAATASCSFLVPQGDKGVSYTFTNRCDSAITVELTTGGREVLLDRGSTYTINTLDRQPDSSFVVRRVGDVDGVTFAPGAADFEIRGDRCPAA